MRISKIFPIVALLVLTLATPSTLSAAGSGALHVSRVPFQKTTVPPPSKTVRHKTLFSMYNWGAGEAATAGKPPLTGGTFTQLDSGSSFTCATPCRITATITAAINSSTNGNQWALCAAIDGEFFDQPECTNQGAADSTSQVTGTENQGICVDQGNHVAYSFIYVTDDATLGPWSITYTVLSLC